MTENTPKSSQLHEGWRFHPQHYLVGSKQRLADTKHTATPTKGWSGWAVLQAQFQISCANPANPVCSPALDSTDLELLPPNPLWPCPCQWLPSSGLKLITAYKYFKELMILNLAYLFAAENKADNQGRQLLAAFKKSTVTLHLTRRKLLSKLFWDVC